MDDLDAPATGRAVTVHHDAHIDAGQGAVGTPASVRLITQPELNVIKTAHTSVRGERMISGAGHRPDPAG